MNRLLRRSFLLLNPRLGLTENNRERHARPRGNYGFPRVHAQLQARDCAASENSKARAVKEADPHAVSYRKGPLMTVRGPRSQWIPDLLDRDFTAESPDELCLADITYSDRGRISLSRSRARCLH